MRLSPWRLRNVQDVAIGLLRDRLVLGEGVTATMAGAAWRQGTSFWRVQKTPPNPGQKIVVVQWCFLNWRLSSKHLFLVHEVIRCRQHGGYHAEARRNLRPRIDR
jgi:hypothetical protein